jgi:hypothetical protein
MPPKGELNLSCLAQHREAIGAVRELLTSVQGILGDNIVAVWFDGSIALGDFDPGRSDIDLVVIAGAPTGEATEALRAVHVGFAMAGPPWGNEVETVYISPAGLHGDAVRSGVPHLYIERQSDGELKSGPVDPGWLVHLRVLREHGRSITGPAPMNIVGTVSDDELKRVAQWGADRWLTPYRKDPATLARLGSRVFAVLTTCRLLYTLQTGQVVAKAAAARWALSAVPGGLMPVIEGAMAWRKDDVDSDLTTVEGALALIDWTQSAGRNWPRH